MLKDTIMQKQGVLKVLIITLIELDDDGEVTIVWTGSHQEYE